VIVPDLEALVAEVEEQAAGIPKPMLRAFLDYYHEHDQRVAWYTPSVLRDRCTRAAYHQFNDVELIDASERVSRSYRLWAYLGNRYAQEHPGVRSPYSTEVICGYVQEMLDARP
jgi:hypothetical protein